MQFNWYKSLLKKRLIDLKKISKNVSEQELPMIKSTIDYIESFISPHPFVNASIDDYLEIDYFNVASTKFLWPIITEIAKLPKLPVLKANIPQDVNLSNDDLLLCVHNFFNFNTDSKTKEIFEKYWQMHKTHTQFVTDAPPGFYANTFYLGYYKEAFIQINRQFTFDDIFTLIHEYGHIIQFDSNYFTADNPNLRPFIEIVSTFFELIGAEYYARDELEIEGIISQYLVWEELLQWAKILNDELNIMKKIAIKPYENENDLRENIKHYIKNDNLSDIRELLFEDPIINYKYIIGFFVSCNLFMIYLSDPKLAFHILHEFMKINTLSPEEYYYEIAKLGLTNIEQITAYREHIKRKLIF